MIEKKFNQVNSDLSVDVDLEGHVQIAGYASRFGLVDQGGDRVAKGAFAASLAKLSQSGAKVRMLWQHDPSQPIGVWDELYEDDTGLWVKGRVLNAVARGREAAALLAAGAIDGLSIGYRTIKSESLPTKGRILREIELWEVSLVTFPMLASARVAAKSAHLAAECRALTAALHDARRAIATV